MIFKSLATILIAVTAFSVRQSFAEAATNQPPRTSVTYQGITYNNFILGGVYSGASAEFNSSNALYSISGKGDISGGGGQLGWEFSSFEHLYLSLGATIQSASVKGSLDVTDLIGGTTYSLGGSIDFNYLTANIGGGFYFQLAENVDFVTELGLDYADMSFSGILSPLSNDDIGLYAIPHLRAKFGLCEIHSGVKATTNDITTSSCIYFARIMFEIEDGFDMYLGGYYGLTGNGQRISTDNAFGFQLGVRIKF